MVEILQMLWVCSVAICTCSTNRTTNWNVCLNWLDLCYSTCRSTTNLRLDGRLFFLFLFSLNVHFSQCSFDCVRQVKGPFVPCFAKYCPNSWSVVKSMSS